MKSILVPTDFSPAATNAIDYAAELAKRTNAAIILFHAFHPPVATLEAAILMPGIDEQQKECTRSLKTIERDLKLKHGNQLSVQTVCKPGFAVDEISQYASSQNADLIVMGMQGAGYIREKFLGSVTTTLIRKAECPVLAVPLESKFKDIGKIAFACDYRETGNRQILGPLKRFVRLFNAHIYVLNVQRENEPVSSVRKVVSEYVMLEDSLADLPHTFHYLENKNVVQGITQFIEEEEMDMVVMIPRKHTILENLFTEPNTKKMAFHANIPLLALH